MNLSRTVFVGQGPNKTAWTRAGQLACVNEIGGGLEFAVLCHCAPARSDRGRWPQDPASCSTWTAMSSLRSPTAGTSTPGWNGKNGKGDKFDRFEREVTAQMLLKAGQFDDFVLFGAESAKCFNIPYRPAQHPGR